MEEESSDPRFRLSAYLHRSSGIIAKNNVEEHIDDHNYMRTPHPRLEVIFAKPMRTLFVHPSDSTNTGLAAEEGEEELDVEGVEAPVAPVYEAERAVTLMDEVENHILAHKSGEGNPDWEDQIPKFNWTQPQTRLFSKVVRVLHSDHLMRLAHEGDVNEPVLRRVTVDMTARRLRQIFAGVEWNNKYTHWLHNLLMDNLPPPYLVSYLDAMQTLKAKVPTLVERMLMASTSRSTFSAPHHELLSVVYRRPWDPVSAGIKHHKLKKLPKEPILVMVPSGPGTGTNSSSRTHHWMASLSALGMVVCVYSSAAEQGKVTSRVVGKTSTTNCLDHMLVSTRAKVAELHADYEDKPIVLVGIGCGAMLACQVALMEQNVAAVVCLGFPLHTAGDNRGTPDDSLLNVQVPALFIVGQNATTCSIGELEDLREKLNVVTSLVVVGSADDQLRLTNSRLKLNKITQPLVDKCVVDEVADFLGTLLSPDYVAPTRPIITHSIEPPPKRNVIKTVERNVIKTVERNVIKTVERKRKADLDVVSPDIIRTPTKKGRKPKLSMMQKIVHNKWAAQVNESPRNVSEAQTFRTIASVPTPPPPQAQTISITTVGSPIKSVKRSVSMSSPAVTPSIESTITVVAASSPTLTHAVKSRLASGQLTSLSSILQPGTRGVLSPGSRTVTSAESPAILDELNILDMPVILGEEELPQVTLPAPTPSPVKLILTSAKPRGSIKYVGTPQGTKILISKAVDGKDRKTIFLGDKSAKIRTIPATKRTNLL